MTDHSRIATGDAARIGIVTVSDRASRGEYEDRGGPAIRDYLDEVLTSPWTAVARVIPDELPQVDAALQELADREGCCLIITTGGTGPAPRHHSRGHGRGVPEDDARFRRADATGVSAKSADRHLVAPDSGDSRSLSDHQSAGPAARIRECLDAVFPAIPYCIDLIGGPYLQTNEPRLVAFRPKTSA